ncbi:hypothetical protein MJO29_011087 [Puccinia striiformis f. sp. tritici]|nr:hypothetical protein MJO29_011087 [Puccinia striiformis f. sp. tritici]KAI9621817.1 hypothetical protein KEM48_007555 [Puccinia striiformis f. sp. tritici PST-130]
MRWAVYSKVQQRVQRWQQLSQSRGLTVDQTSSGCAAGGGSSVQASRTDTSQPAQHHRAYKFILLIAPLTRLFPSTIQNIARQPSHYLFYPTTQTPIPIMSYGNNQGYGHPTQGWQQNQQQYPPHNQGGQYGQQGGQYGQPAGQYGQQAPQNYGNAPGGGYQAQPSHGQSNQYNDGSSHGQHNYSQPQNQFNSNSQQQGSGQPGDRGLMGAVAGGAAGGLVGKKNNHGFLGTIGGAIVGSLLEDATKKKKHGNHH